MRLEWLEKREVTMSEKREMTRTMRMMRMMRMTR